MLNTQIRRAQKGFSLVEMLAVLVLIGIVAAVVVTNVLPRLGSGQVSAAKTGVQSLAMSVETYYLDNSRLPERLEDLVSKPGNANNWNGPYARASQLSDPWGNPYGYRRPGGEGRQFDIVSLGRNGQDGGEGPDRTIGSWE